MPEDPATPQPEPTLAEDLAVQAAAPPAGDTPSQDPDPAVEPAPDGAAEDDATRIATFYAENFNPNATGKFKDDWEFLRSHREMETMLGQRNEDAALGKQLRGHEQEFQQYLTSRSQQQPVAPSQPEQVPNFEAFRLLQQQVVRDPDTGRPVPAEGAPPDAVQRLERALEAQQRTIHDLTYNPQKVLAPLFQAQSQILQQQAAAVVEQQTRAAQDRGYVQQYEQANSNWLYRDGQNPASGITPQGQRFQDYCGQAAQAGVSTMGGVLNYATMAMRAEAVGQPRTLPTKPAAQRKPDVAQQQTATPTEAELIENESLLESLMRQANAAT